MRKSGIKRLVETRARLAKSISEQDKSTSERAKTTRELLKTNQELVNDNIMKGFTINQQKQELERHRKKEKKLADIINNV